ncbi:MAG: carbohydrate binding family 9 domain-containing protein [Lewinellaceae bacterium]|nr:carbohydrate binding family 9 domain-containing protein [Lewinellaceae bacterium]
MKEIRTLCCVLIALTSSLTQGLAQTPQELNPYQLIIRQAKAVIRLDGDLNEADWQNAAVAQNFFLNFPDDTAQATDRTEVRVTFDQQYLYVGAIIYQENSSYITNSLKRDFAGGSSDVFVVNIDPFQDKLNGFHFAVSPFNVQREGILDNGSNLSLDWDNKWYSQVKNHADHWVVEMAIPFKTLRYKLQEGQNVWRINFGRNARQRNEISSWYPVPRQFSPHALAFTGLLIWEDAPPKPGLNASLIPYFRANTERDFEFKLPNETGLAVGGDAKIALTPSLNLDLTINPDFSQVEVDRQLTNLSRFELFFPERRQFFLENEDLFSRFGFPDSRPFFSRRIGIANGLIRRTTTDGQTIEVNRTLNVPIRAGMRLSGKLDNNWRIGLLNMQTAALPDISLNPANYTVGVLQRRIFSRSTLGAVLVNKENFQETADGTYALDRQAYNRIVGLEYNLYSKDNKWDAEAYYHRALYENAPGDASSAALYVGYNNRFWNVMLANQYVGENYRAEVGFVPRTGMYSIFNQLRHFIFPKKAEKLILWGFGLTNNITYNTSPEFQLTDRKHTPNIFFQFPGQSELTLSLTQEHTFLFFPFDPTNSGGRPLPQDSEYTYYYANLQYQSDTRRRISYEASLQQGEFFNGNLFQFSGSLSYRWQPYGTFALSYAFNDISLPSPHNSATFWLVGPRAELSFTRNLFFSTFLQYNTQADNVNINSRLQWRFKPVSDLFLVYTDNYFSDQFFQSPQVKNRALVLKVTYWLNL